MNPKRNKKIEKLLEDYRRYWNKAEVRPEEWKKALWRKIENDIIKKYGKPKRSQGKTSR